MDTLPRSVNYSAHYRLGLPGQTVREVHPVEEEALVAEDVGDEALGGLGRGAILPALNAGVRLEPPLLHSLRSVDSDPAVLGHRARPAALVS